ncbi:MAG: ABC transporter ATP-binding protein [Acidobacteria bacterium]|nr:MAG: ABC transporter ATP-binding protein [Acidobacteriota bacterium]
MTAEPVLEVQALSKSYGEREAVRSVSFSLRRGEVFGLLGPNGAGKTTTIGVIAGILAPSSGTVRCAGALGLVPQRVALYPSLTAEENLDFFGRLYGLSKSEARARRDQLLELSGLSKRAQQRVAEFSDGMKRRLNLACGVVHAPEVLLLDEPTVGVDPQSRERIYDSLTALAAEGMALLLTTHYMDEAERLCDRLVIMDEGSLIAEGSVEELVARSSLERSLELQLERPPNERLARRLSALGAHPENERTYLLTGKDKLRALPDLLAFVASEGNEVQELNVHRPNLGDVFLQLTGKGLRD